MNDKVLDDDEIRLIESEPLPDIIEYLVGMIGLINKKLELLEKKLDDEVENLYVGVQSRFQTVCEIMKKKEDEPEKLSNEIKTQSFVSQQELVRMYNFYTENQLRNLIYQNVMNFKSRCCAKVGKRIHIHVEEFLKWYDEYQIARVNLNNEKKT